MKYDQKTGKPMDEFAEERAMFEKGNEEESVEEEVGEVSGDVESARAELQTMVDAFNEQFPENAVELVEGA